MQFKSTLARLAAFAFFLLSFSMLVCAAPAPVAVPGAGELAVRDSSLVARTDFTPQCKVLLLELKANLKVKCDALVTCSKTPGCDCGPHLAGITLLIKAFVEKIKVQVKLGAIINVSLVIDICIDILVFILLQLQLCVGLTASLCTDLGLILAIFVQLFLDLCDVVLKVVILLKFKLAVVVYVNLCLSLGFKGLLSCLGLP